MELSYNITGEDYLDFNLLYIIKSETVRKFFYFQKIVNAIILLLGTFFFTRYFKIPIIVALVGYLLTYLTWAVIEAILIKFILVKKLTNDLKRKPELVGKKILSIEEEGIYDHSGPSKLLVSWKNIEKVELVDSFIYISTSINSGYIIPRKFLEEESSFLDLLDSKV